MAKRMLLIWFIYLFLTQACSQSPIEFRTLTMLNYVDTNTDNQINRGEHILIRNFSDTKEAQHKIDSFVFKNFSKEAIKYNDYKVILYKESEKTNEKSILENRRIIDRYSQSHDLIYVYIWMKGKYLAKQRFRNGVSDDEGEIKIEDINR